MLNKKIVARFRILSAVLAASACGLYAYNYHMVSQNSDDTIPEITFESDVLELSTSDPKTDYFKGVKAYDGKDGDVTDNVIVESVSKLLDNNERIVTYAVFDEDNHVGKAERRIRYTDYYSPRYSLDQAVNTLGYSINQRKLATLLHAYDCLDGDVTARIQSVGYETTGTTADSFTEIYSFQVANSCGDISTIALPITIGAEGSTTSVYGSDIVLSDYIIYVEANSDFIYRSVIQEVSALGYHFEYEDNATVKYGGNLVSIDKSNLDMSTPGMYIVPYRLTGKSLGKWKPSDEDFLEEWQRKVENYGFEESDCLVEIDLIVFVTEMTEEHRLEWEQKQAEAAAAEAEASSEKPEEEKSDKKDEGKEKSKS